MLNLTETDLGGITNLDSSTCSGYGGFSDISEGTQVTVTDGNGATVAVGQLDQGTGQVPSCSFSFEITGIPAGRAFYKVDVSHRGGLTYTEAQLKSGITLTLGS